MKKTNWGVQVFFTTLYIHLNTPFLMILIYWYRLGIVINIIGLVGFSLSQLVGIGWISPFSTTVYFPFSVSVGSYRTQYAVVKLNSKNILFSEEISRSSSSYAKLHLKYTNEIIIIL